MTIIKTVEAKRLEKVLVASFLSEKGEFAVGNNKSTRRIFHVAQSLEDLLQIFFEQVTEIGKGY